ncbi:hypothetical protein ANO11243_008110 [Dothideomycetidae sp. 11243]|nr:hypothetical protein ANO11243_008110 [fungal sp. No.11243]
MSSRALRKAQKQREEEETLRRLKEEAEALESSEEEAETDLKPQQSAFALLNDQGNESQESEDDDRQIDSDNAQQEDSRPEVKAPTKKATKKKKKKSKKAKAQAAGTDPDSEADGNNSLDDIDAALRTLSTQAKGGNEKATETVDPVMADACKLLAIDSQNLHAENEMKRLFGRAAMESSDDDQQQAGQGRRRNRPQQMGGLAAALGRRQGAQGGRSSGLGLLGLRRNLFIQGKEEWPIGTSGGLGMEIVEKRADGVVEYRFVHNKAYQDVQADFDICVRGMDPERMIALLQQNPYHISTLLQVSEIAKHERDAATAGDLLERALFSFGRALHSTFAANLGQGKARLDFRRPENREFWLAVSRYMINLSMRATWRTVFEWAKLLLSLDPENDPYRIRLAIDQYALRARQPQQLLDMAANPLLAKDWNFLPNMQLSLALATVQAGRASAGKQLLFTAANRAPWTIAALFNALSLDAPPGIWGATPRTAWEKLTTGLYAARAKDLWASPEAQALLTEVASAVSGTVNPSPPENVEITKDDARHVFLLADDPALIALLPRSLSAGLTSASDPLPPDDEIRVYERRLDPMVQQQRQDPGTLFAALSRLLPAMRGLLAHEEQGEEVGEADVEAVLGGEGISRADFEQALARLRELTHDRRGAHGEEEDGSE